MAAIRDPSMPKLRIEFEPGRRIDDTASGLDKIVLRRAAAGANQQEGGGKCANQRTLGVRLRDLLFNELQIGVGGCEAILCLVFLMDGKGTRELDFAEVSKGAGPIDGATSQWAGLRLPAFVAFCPVEVLSGNHLQPGSREPQSHLPTISCAF